MKYRNLPEDKAVSSTCDTDTGTGSNKVMYSSIENF